MKRTGPKLRSSLPLVGMGALLLLFCSSCGHRATRVEHGNQNQILHLGNGAEPQDLDPQITTGVPEHAIAMALFEGLVSEDPHDLHPVPGVAESWEINLDGTVYTFHLRNNARWSNGDPVTALDFVKSYERILTPSLAAEYAYMFYPVKNAEAFNKGELKHFSEVGVKARDARTLIITLHHSTPYFLSMLNHSSWFPVHIPTIQKHGRLFERGNRWTLPENFVGNGPFVPKEWRINDRIVAEKSPTYWDAARVKLKQIRFYAIESSDTEERAFRAGQLHLTHEAPLAKIDVYKRMHPEWLRIEPYLGVYFYQFNVTRPPLKDKRVRQALALAIDREAIVESVTRGGQLPAYSFVPPGPGGYTPKYRLAGNVEKARRLLAEAGFADGQNFPHIKILFNTYESHRTIAEAVQQMWKKNLNIDVELVNQEWKVYLDSQKQLNYDVSRFGWIGDYADANSFLDMWLTGGGNNRTGWSNPEYDRLIREAGETLDQSKRREIFQQAEAILLDDGPVAPIYFYTRVYLAQSSVQGWWPTILDHHPYKYVFLQSTTP